MVEERTEREKEEEFWGYVTDNSDPPQPACLLQIIPTLLNLHASQLHTTCLHTLRHTLHTPSTHPIPIYVHHSAAHLHSSIDGISSVVVEVGEFLGHAL